MIRNLALVLCGLLLALFLVCKPAQADPVLNSAFWLSSGTSGSVVCVGGITAYNDGTFAPSTGLPVAIVKNVSLRGVGWKAAEADGTGTITVTLDTYGDLVSELVTTVAYSVQTGIGAHGIALYGPPTTLIATVDSTCWADGAFSMGILFAGVPSVGFGPRGQTAIGAYSTGTNADGSITQLPVTMGSVFLDL